MIIKAYHHPMRLWIMDNGESITVDSLPDAKVGDNVQVMEGQYVVISAELCES